MDTPEKNQNKAENNEQALPNPEVKEQEISKEEFTSFIESERKAFSDETFAEIQSLNSVGLEQDDFDVLKKDTGVEADLGAIDRKAEDVIEQTKKKIYNENGAEGQIKSGVDFVFDQNPELSAIGTKEEYSLYVDTLFPESKLKDILYRQDALNLEYFTPSQETQGIYASADLNEVRQYGGRRKAGESKVYGTVFDIRNPKEYQLRWYSTAIHHTNLAQAISEGKDSVLVTGRDGEKNIEVAVVGTEQSIILGSKEDLEKFKKFVSNSKTESASVDTKFEINSDLTETRQQNDGTSVE